MSSLQQMGLISFFGRPFWGAKSVLEKTFWPQCQNTTSKFHENYSHKGICNKEAFSPEININVITVTNHEEFPTQSPKNYMGAESNMILTHPKIQNAALFFKQNLSLLEVRDTESERPKMIRSPRDKHDDTGRECI